MSARRRNNTAPGRTTKRSHQRFLRTLRSSLVRYENTHEAMGTVFTVVAYGLKCASLDETVDQAFREVDRMDGQLSHYKPASELSIVNREAYGRTVIVGPELFRLLEDSLRYSEETFGAFDVTAGHLMKSWGFFLGLGRVPSRAKLAEARERVGYQHVKLDTPARSVRFDRRGIELDLGAIGKGYAVDRVIEILREAGIERACVSSGSSTIYALGSPPGERGWKVAVRNPLGGAQPASILRLQNLALSVSACCEKFFESSGKTYGHIMDPRAGTPAGNLLMSMAISPSATDSDALSTAFFVGGVNRSREYLQHHPNRGAIFYLRTRFGRALRRLVLNSKFSAGSFLNIEEE